ncbi:hypothetical protein CspeluHIS016_0206860 [Cutaneotrichosporon spelunceum]|uniref:Uracil-DNA glycosylase-like domain-containing protein n=1 Tax=Cutaneotrichosporon spelunceum TaxID=1672016 RepID=A0AAD3TSI9_9TREE|nr:hypothetical protein CspeluHIS016_0206860 [Cutaneotrichosporon spelunceum]
MTSPADNLRSRLAQYAYAHAPSSPRRSRRVRTTSGPTSGPTSGLASGPASGYTSDDEASPSPRQPDGPKRRSDGSLDKFKWKKSRRYAHPDKYAHYTPTRDKLVPDLKLVFCGINPGLRSSKSGHHFAHPTNKFWRALYLSGLTPRLLSPEEDLTLPEAYRYGLTNLVSRVTAEQNELSPAEMRLAVLPLVEKFARFRPRVVCFVGKKIWDIFEGVVGVEERRRQKEAKRNGEREVKVAALALVDRAVVKIEPEEVVVKQGDGDGGLREEAADDDTKPDVDEPLVSVEDVDLTPIKSRYIRAVPHSNFAYDAPQRFRLVLRPAELTKDEPSEVGSDGVESPPSLPRSSVPCSSRSSSLSAAPSPSPPTPPSTHTHTYFWVVPNTSGLERTPLDRQAELFGQLKAFVESFEAGEPEGDFVDFTLADVEAAAEALGRATAKKQ